MRAIIRREFSWSILVSGVAVLVAGHVASADPPTITLNYPENGVLTENLYMELSTTVEDPEASPMTI